MILFCLPNESTDPDSPYERAILGELWAAAIWRVWPDADAAGIYDAATRGDSIDWRAIAAQDHPAIRAIADVIADRADWRALYRALAADVIVLGLADALTDLLDRPVHASLADFDLPAVGYMLHIVAALPQDAVVALNIARDVSTDRLVARRNGDVLLARLADLAGLDSRPAAIGDVPPVADAIADRLHEHVHMIVHMHAGHAFWRALDDIRRVVAA